MSDQPYRGTHRHRAPLGWHPTRTEPETTDGGPDTLRGEPTQPYVPTFTGELPAQPDPVQPLAAETDCRRESRRSRWPAPVQPGAVPSAYQYLKRWRFVLVVAGVWIVGAAVGLGLYHWWFHSLDKTPPVFVVLVFLIVCTVGSLLIAMVKQQAAGVGAGDRGSCRHRSPRPLPRRCCTASTSAIG